MRDAGHRPSDRVHDGLLVYIETSTLCMALTARTIVHVNIAFCTSPCQAVIAETVENSDGNAKIVDLRKIYTIENSIL